MDYTKDEKVGIIFIFGPHQECARESARIFNERHPDKNVSHKCVLKMVNKFRETGFIANKPPVLYNDHQY